MGKDIDAERPETLGAVTRELEAMSDWELERGCAASLGFDDSEGWLPTASCANDMPDQSEV